ncbi:MAG TPA: helix-turn-helix domain-containing protein [Chitinophagaceae bacterium]|nr:helix-turn-helix domain-containing protein [Chitinophagaceae bacterium]
MTHKIEKDLEVIRDHIQAQTLNAKAFLTLSEAADYLGVSKSLLYKKTAAREIPFCRPGDGKLIYFDRAELTEWVLSNRQGTSLEIAESGIEHFTSKNRKK